MTRYDARWRNGRRYGLKIRSGVTRVWVQIPPALLPCGLLSRWASRTSLGVGLFCPRGASCFATGRAVDSLNRWLVLNPLPPTPDAPHCSTGGCTRRFGVPSNLLAGPQGDCSIDRGCLQWRVNGSMILAFSDPAEAEPTMPVRSRGLAAVPH